MLVLPDTLDFISIKEEWKVKRTNGFNENNISVASFLRSGLNDIFH